MKISDETVSNIIKLLVTITMACIVYFAFSYCLLSPVKEIKNQIKEAHGNESHYQYVAESNNDNITIKKVEVDGHCYIYTEKKFKLKDWGGYNYQYSISLVHDENCKCKTINNN